MLKKMNLSSKLAVIIGTILSFVFVILIISTIIMSKIAIEKGIFGELYSVTNSNGIQIKDMFKNIEETGKSIENYLKLAKYKEKFYPKKTFSFEDFDFNTLIDDEKVKNIKNLPDINSLINKEKIYNFNELFRSVLYKDILLSPTLYDIEQFILGTSASLISNRSDINSIGVMFEPYKFESTMESFGFYISKNNIEGKNVGISGLKNYQDYANQYSYKQAIQTKEIVISKPYDYNGNLVISCSIPIIENNEAIGVLVAIINIDSFSNIIDSDSENYESMWVTICDNDTNIIWSSNDINSVNKNILDSYNINIKELEELKTKLNTQSPFNIKMKYNNEIETTVFYTPIKIGNEILWSSTGLFTKDAQSLVNHTILILLIISLLSLVCIILTIIFVLKRMLNPINNIVFAAENIVKGDLNIEIDINSNDEVGRLSQVFYKMAENIKAIIKDTDYLLNEMSNGNFCVNTKEKERYIGEYKGIFLAMKCINRTLSKTLSDINIVSDKVALSSKQVSTNSQSLSNGASEQNASVKRLASSVTNISENIKNNAINAQQASEKTILVSDKVLESNKKMQQTLIAMEEIKSSSNEIGEIIKTIEEIAFQTNILALNAAVEAARAGTAGKGFAVVADEVRNLAGKSSEASKSTTRLIESSLEAIEKGTRSMDETAKSMIIAVNGVKEITDTIKNISLASDEQADSITEIIESIDEISNVVQNNSSMAKESALESENLFKQSQILKDMINKFHLRETEEDFMNIEDICKNKKFRN